MPSGGATHKTWCMVSAGRSLALAATSGAESADQHLSDVTQISWTRMMCGTFVTVRLVSHCSTLSAVGTLWGTAGKICIFFRRLNGLLRLTVTLKSPFQCFHWIQFIICSVSLYHIVKTYQSRSLYVINKSVHVDETRLHKIYQHDQKCSFQFLRCHENQTVSWSHLIVFLSGTCSSLCSPRAALTAVARITGRVYRWLPSAAGQVPLPLLPTPPSAVTLPALTSYHQLTTGHLLTAW